MEGSLSQKAHPGTGGRGRPSGDLAYFSWTYDGTGVTMQNAARAAPRLSGWQETNQGGSRSGGRGRQGPGAVCGGVAQPDKL